MIQCDAQCYRIIPDTENMIPKDTKRNLMILTDSMLNVKVIRLKKVNLVTVIWVII